MGRLLTGARVGVDGVEYCAEPASRTSSMQYKGVRKALAQIAKELGVDIRTNAEVARILRELADQVEIDHMGKPRDVNGNACGDVKATGDDRELA